MIDSAPGSKTTRPMVKTVRSARSARSASRSLPARAAEAQGEAAHPDDRGDHADALALGLEHRALLDVGLEIGGVALRLEPRRRFLRQARGLEGLGDAAALRVGGAAHLRVVQGLGKGGRAEAAQVAAFLVHPGGDVEGQVGVLRVLGQGAGRLQRVDHPQGAVEPAAARLGVRVGPHEERSPGLGRAADDVADAVDPGLESGLGHAPRQPAPRRHVRIRERRAHYPGAAGAECPQRLEVVQEALGVDLWRHDKVPCSSDGRAAAIFFRATGRSPSGQARPRPVWREGAGAMGQVYFADLP
jgi:hypothetical protein